MAELFPAADDDEADTRICDDVGDDLLHAHVLGLHGTDYRHRMSGNVYSAPPDDKHGDWTLAISDM